MRGSKRKVVEAQPDELLVFTHQLPVWDDDAASVVTATFERLRQILREEIETYGDTPPGSANRENETRGWDRRLYSEDRRTVEVVDEEFTWTIVSLPVKHHEPWASSGDRPTVVASLAATVRVIDSFVSEHHMS